MTDATPEEKLLNLIRKDQSKARIGKDLKIFTKINIALIGLIGVVMIVFLADVFIFKKKPVEELTADLEARIPETHPEAIEKTEGLLKENKIEEALKVAEQANDEGLKGSQDA